MIREVYQATENTQNVATEPYDYFLGRKEYTYIFVTQSYQRKQINCYVIVNTHTHISNVKIPKEMGE